eukprot:5165870-Amphidinium_carterae.1
MHKRFASDKKSTCLASDEAKADLRRLAQFVQTRTDSSVSLLLVQQGETFEQSEPLIRHSH